METKTLVINAIIYLILTSALGYILINEKKLEKKIKEKRRNFSEKLIIKWNIQNNSIKNFIIKFVDIFETLASAVILVLIIQKFYLGNFLVPTGSMIPTIIPKDRLFGNMFIYKFTKPQRGDIIVFKEPIQNKVLYTKRLAGLAGEKIKIKDNSLYINNEKISGEFNKKYYQMGKMEDKEWVIPKKGDKIKIIVDKESVEKLKKLSIGNFDIEKLQNDMYKTPYMVSEIFPNTKFLLNEKETGMILDFFHDKEILKKMMEEESIEFILKEDYYFALGDNSANSLDSRFWGFVAESRIKGKTLLRFWPLNRIGLVK